MPAVFSNEIFQAAFAGRPVPFSGNYRRHKMGKKRLFLQKESKSGGG